jgi:hypothetical protein
METVSKKESKPPYRVVIVLGNRIWSNYSEKDITLMEAQGIRAEALANGLQNAEIWDALDRKVDGPDLAIVEEPADTAGLVYDHDTAVRFVVGETGLADSVVQMVLKARDRYNLGLGIWNPEEEAEKAEEQALQAIYEAEKAEQQALRVTYPQFFPQEHIDQRYAGHETAFIVETTKLDPALVGSVMDADHEYMRRIGIVD